ncbi:hypothetical protein Tsubulata_038682 [Turnera subulata]|uniref:Cystatin domain-containing protein n=1 Tax=Turnera subulata TaxID=218843 RepID=A0A9Q0JKZ4_9ROSI|nr:hypothetical protein Tsubulata_038682 [Turnera subulata]
MADSRSFSSSPEKKKAKLDHEPGLLHHAAAGANLGAISSSAPNQVAESVAGDAVSGPEVDYDPMMTQEEEEEDDYGGGSEEKAHHDDSTLADDNIESDSQADDESDADGEEDARSSTPEHGEISVRRQIENDQHRQIYDECQSQSEKSGGFDIDVDPNIIDNMPKWIRHHMVHPLRVDHESFAPKLEEMGKLACEYANSNQNSNQSELQRLEFLKVVKANYNPIMFRYYITFAAVDKLDQSDGPNGKAKLYQAVIFFVDCRYKMRMRVEMVSRKPPVADDDGTAAAQDV